MVATALPAAHFRVAAAVIEAPRTAGVEQGRSAAKQVLRELSAAGARPGSGNTLAILG